MMYVCDKCGRVNTGKLCLTCKIESNDTIELNARKVD
jgi:hypothetical protein